MMSNPPTEGSSSEPSPPTRETSDAALPVSQPLTVRRWPLSPTGRPIVSAEDVCGRTRSVDLGLTDPDLLKTFDRVRRIFRLLGSVNGLRLSRAVALLGRTSVARLAQRMPDFPAGYKGMLDKMEALGLVTLKKGTHWDLCLVEPTDFLLWLLPAGILDQSTPTPPPALSGGTGSQGPPAP